MGPSPSHNPVLDKWYRILMDRKLSHSIFKVDNAAAPLTVVFIGLSEGDTAGYEYASGIINSHSKECAGYVCVCPSVDT